MNQAPYLHNLFRLAIMQSRKEQAMTQNLLVINKSGNENNFQSVIRIIKNPHKIRPASNGREVFVGQEETKIIYAITCSAGTAIDQNCRITREWLAVKNYVYSVTASVA
jgi:hypothetical protein